MVRTLSPITVTIRAGDGSPIACGVIYSVASTGACIATSVPLAVGEMLRFRVSRQDPPSMAEHLGKVLWTKKSVNPSGHHIARCQVEWLNVSEACPLPEFRQPS